MDIKLFSLQCAIFYRSLFLNYGKYAELIQEVFSDKTDPIEAPKDIQILPDDVYFMQFDGGNSFKASISKIRTDIFYYEEKDYHNYNEEVDNFIKRLYLFINKIFKSENICTRIGIISSSMLYTEEPIIYIKENYLNKNFTKVPSQLTITYNIPDELEGIKVNRLTTIQEQEYIIRETGDAKKVVDLKLDINTNGFREKISCKYLQKFIGKYKDDIKMEAISELFIGK